MDHKIDRLESRLNNSVCKLQQSMKMLSDRVKSLEDKIDGFCTETPLQIQTAELDRALEKDDYNVCNSNKR